MLILAAGAALVAQDGHSPQQFFETGEDEQALRAIATQRETGTAGPDETFLAGQILLRLDRDADAKKEFGTLEAAGAPWALIGASAVALIDGQNQRAVDLATQAVGQTHGSFYAHYQLGLAKARFNDWAACAEAFRRATEIDPSYAYAHYYAGLSYSRMRRADRTSEHFERFLRLAPTAPERAAVESLMRTLRGR
jgi:tetratricopeptide (TPR) repeat protein